MKNFKIYCVSNEDNSKYEISLNELVTKGSYTEEEVCKLLDYIEQLSIKLSDGSWYIRVPPVDEYVFSEIEDMFNFGELERVAMNNIVKTSDTFVLYVTGLTVATVSVINVAKNLGYKQIALKHYNRDSGLYECQWVY